MADQYDFSDFTRDNYRRLLRLARETYHFRRFVDFDQGERFVLWRHDLDFSLHAARQVAGIEAAEGVVSTYFLHLHSEFYNLLEHTVANCVRDIISLGHDVGLHFDNHFFDVSSATQLDHYLRRERKILEEFFEREVRVFSFHNTDGFTDTCRELVYGDMINVYAEYFRRDVGYVSDSNGYWRHRRLEDVLVAAEDRCLQVLTHPAWWQETAMPPAQRVERCVQGRAQATMARYDELLRQSGRENVGRRRPNP